MATGVEENKEQKNGEQENRGQSDRVLVVGAGIGGMGAALLLAEAGFQVYLLDQAPAIGGSQPLLDRTFPTNSCGLCFMSPTPPAYCPFIECDRHPNIHLLPYTEVEELEGEPGRFQVTIRQKARYVDPTRCDGCGACAAVCPVEVPRELGEGLETRKAIYRPYPQAVPNAFLVDMAACTRCGECLEVCQPKAIDFEQEDQLRRLEVGAVLLGPGFAPFDARAKGEFGYGLYPNVLTSFQFERMLSLTGPSGGLPQRPSDGTPPRRIAFIQCVGSRDAACGQSYCSSVCCMYATKQAMLAREREPKSRVAVFYMDLRTFGKEFDRYVERAQDEYSVEYRRSMVSAVKQVPDSQNLRLSYVAEDGQPREEEFDLVILSLGFVPPAGAETLAQLGFDLNEYGFCRTDEFAPSQTTRPGVFVAGAFREPKDIPETVAEAAGAAAAVAQLLAGARGRPAPPAREAPPERDVSEEEPRVGVFACRCDGIEEVVDLARVLDRARGLKDVAHVQELSNACDGEGMEEIKRQIAEKGLNRIVVAGCTHRLYETVLQEALREAGLNPALLGRADLREGCAWVHWDQPEVATAKAQDLVEMAVAKARLLKPVTKSTCDVKAGALVIGGGLAGMTAALSLAGQGFPVHLAEKEAELGGNLHHVHHTLYGADAQALLRSLVHQVEENELIRVYLGAEVRGVSGSVGNFTVRVRGQQGNEATRQPGNEGMRQRGNEATREQVGGGNSLTYPLGNSLTLNVGVIIVATGGQEAVPTEYLYGEDPRVMTQREFEAILVDSELVDSLPSSVVMIQCVGSREPERPYCSRICCSQAMKNTLRLKEMNPQAQVFVLYRDIRTYGFKEEAYRRAREEGVAFIRYDPDDKPQVVGGDEGLRVLVNDPVLGERLALDADLLVLSTGIVPYENGALAEILEVPLDTDGFFQEANSKVRPMDFERAGIFLCGLAQAPRFIDETIVQADGAALRAAILLSKERLESRTMIAMVNERLCSACELCVEACPYDARSMDPERGVAVVDPILCQGCGVCVMVCPNGASQQNTFEMRQVMAMLDATI